MRWALVALLLGSVACSHLEVRVVPLGPVRGVRHTGVGVEVVRPPVTELHVEEVALIEVTGYARDALGEVLDALRNAASEVGADRVVVLRTDRGSGFLRVVGSALRATSARTNGASSRPR